MTLEHVQLDKKQIDVFLAETVTLDSALCYGQWLSDINFSQDEEGIKLNLEAAIPLGSFEDLLKQDLLEKLSSHFPSVPYWNINFHSQIKAFRAANDVKAFNGIKNIIAVASGKGGVGKSSTAVNLALALKALGANVGLLDADIYGPNLALMLGVPEDTRPEVEAQKYLVPLKVQGIQSMSMSYVATESTPMVWRGPKASGAFSQLMGTTLWHELDYLLIDMPPGTGDIQLTLAQTIPVNGAVIVSTPQNMATQDARKGIEMFRKVNVPVLGVVENMSTHICSQCGHEEHVFGEGGGEMLANTYGANLLGSLPLDKRIREDCDTGCPTVAKDPDGDIANIYKSIAFNTLINLCAQSEVLQKPGIKLVGD